jgi:transglycosylase-like protein with SLT domain
MIGDLLSVLTIDLLYCRMSPPPICHGYVTEKYGTHCLISVYSQQRFDAFGEPGRCEGKLLPNRIWNSFYRKQILTISPDPPRQCKSAVWTGGGLKLLFDSSLPRHAAIDNARPLVRFVAAAAMLAVGVGASPACAQVMDISPDGIVSVREGAGAATWQVVSPNSGTAEDDGIVREVPDGAVTSVNSTNVPQQYVTAVNYAAASANISANLLASLVWQESRWNPQAVSRKGAIGLTQLMPGTARDLGVNPADPVANLVGGARYLRQLLDQFDGNVENALAAYNAGPARVRSAGGVPAIAETRAYVASIVRRVSSISTGGTQ